MTLINFGNGITVSEDLLNKAAKAALLSTKYMLPEDVRVYAVYREVLNRITEILETSPL